MEPKNAKERSDDLYSQKNIIILSYLAIITIQSIYAAVSKNFQNSVVYLIILVVYSILAFLSHRRNKIATLIMAISILFTGIGTLALGLFLVGFDQVAMKLMSILFGLYLIYGGIWLLLRERKNHKGLGTDTGHVGSDAKS